LVKATKTVEWAGRPTQETCQILGMALAMLARPRHCMRRHPKERAVPLGNGDEITTVRGVDARHWSDGLLQRMALPMRTWMGLSALHSDLVFEGCVKHQGPDT
jgi:hypothetical protein